jgi:hypothetical protein
MYSDISLNCPIDIFERSYTDHLQAARCLSEERTVAGIECLVLKVPPCEALSGGNTRVRNGFRVVWDFLSCSPCMTVSRLKLKAQIFELT